MNVGRTLAGDEMGVAGFERYGDGISPGRPVLLLAFPLLEPTAFLGLAPEPEPDAAGPPPLSTVNGPFLLPVPVLQPSLSIFTAGLFDGPGRDEAEADAKAALALVLALLAPAVAAATPEEGAVGGLGKSGRSFVLVEVALDAGDDFDEVVERGEGP